MIRPVQFFFICILFILAGNTNAAPKAKLWEYWDESDPSSTQRIDHSYWDHFLRTYIQTDPNNINRVPYANISETDKDRLDQYIDDLTNVKVRKLTRNEQLPYWVNLYNALTIKVVLDHYPVDSIKDISISPGFFSIGPWGKKLVEVEGKPLSLDDIEHRILRPIWQDPRIHYAVNCASIGCPNLASMAYTAQNVNTLMDQGAREYVNHPRGMTITPSGLFVSSIYDWFIEDFDDTEQGVIQHLMEYAKPELKSQLESIIKITKHHYDWKLNDAVSE